MDLDPGNKLAYGKEADFRGPSPAARCCDSTDWTSMNEPVKTSIGAYAITRSLPGPGEVYQARSAAGDRVLIRRFGETRGEDGLEAARRDIGICARLDHPAILRAIDVFEDDGNLVLVFDYIEGTKLSQIIKKPVARGKLQGQAVWQLGHQLAGALAQAHGAADASGELAAICHGHLSPAQIVVLSSGEVRIEGFGLGALVGTEAVPRAPGYQAPEEAKGGRVTPRGDLYAAAAILWTLLGGAEPPATGGPKLSLDPIRDRTSAALLQALDRALEPLLTRRKITAAELEQVLTELIDPKQSLEALAEVAKAVTQSGRTLAGTGPAMLGMLARGKGGSPTPEGGAGRRSVDDEDWSRPAAAERKEAEPKPAEPKPEPKPATTAVEPPPAEPPAPAPAAAQAAPGPAKAGKGRLRQATLLGTWPQTPADKAKAASGPRQAVARTGDEPPDDAELGMAVVRAEPAAAPMPPAVERERRAERPTPAAVRAVSRKPTPVGEPAAGPRQPQAKPALGPTDKSPKPPSLRPTPPPAGLAGLDKTVAMAEQPAAGEPAAAGAEGARARPAPPRGAGAKPPAVPSEISDADLADAEDSALEQAMLGATVAMPREAAERAQAEPPAAGSTGAVPSLEPPTAPTVPGHGARPMPPPPPQHEPKGGPPQLRRASSPPALAANAPFDGAAAPAVPPAAPPPPTAPLTGTASPWTPPQGAPGPGPADKPLSLGKAALIAIVTAIVVMVVGLWWTRRQVSLTNLAPAESATVTASAGASASASGSERVAPSAEPPSATAAASGTASAEPSATPSAAATTANSAPEDDPRDGKTLPQNRGLLRVSAETPPDAQVFMMGKPVGPVGKKLEVACGRTFLRVGQPPPEGKLTPPTWLTQGQSVYVQCRMVTEVTLPH